jgi:iron complex outermembrane receptor protein
LRLFVPALLAGATFSAASPAMAIESDELEEVVVTATLADTALSDVAASVTVLNASRLAAAGLGHFSDLTDAVPNLSFAGGTSRPRYFQIRGIGELEQYEGAPNPSVGFLIDDIDFSGIAMPAALFDVAQLEVLRGPQGTAYGANAIAGLVSLRSRAPHSGLELRGEVEAGNYGARAAGLVYNASADATRSAWRLALHRTVGDGFRRNAYLQRDDTNGIDENLLRLGLTQQVGETLAVHGTVLYSDADNGYDAWSIDNSRVTQTDRPGVDAQRTTAVSVRADYSGWRGGILRSISTWADADMRYAFDGDWGNPTFWGTAGPYDFAERIDRRRRNVSQELRWLGDARGASTVVAGVFALHTREHYALLDQYNGAVYRALDSNYRALNLAAYGQWEWRLTPATSFSAGARIERRGARYGDSNGLVREPVDAMTGGHLALNWRYGEHSSVYLAATRGYKAGGINTTAAPVATALREFAPEFLWNIETGLQWSSPDGRLHSRSSVFYMRRSDQQVSSSVQVDPTDPLTFVLLTDNAARGENFGLETQLAWQVLRSLRIEATLGLLRARFLDYQLEGRDLNGRDSPHAPRVQAGLALAWAHPQGLFAGAEFNAQEGFYFSASHDERAHARQLLTLRAGYDAGRWVATVFARNLLDERYAVHGFFFGNEPPDFVSRRYVQNGDPRQIGLRVSFGFL